MGTKRAATYNGNKGGECTPAERLAHCLRAQWVCPYCMGELEADSEGRPTPRVHIDHVFPQLLGGGKSPQNQVAACASCNCAKKAKLLADFAAGRADTEMVKRVKKLTARKLDVSRAKRLLSE